MFRRDWRSDLALGGWVIAGILAALLYSEKVADRYSFGHPKAQQEAKAGNSQQSVPKSNRPPPSSFKRQLPPKEYEPDCTKREDYDLCAQRRMAIAAEDQGRLNIIGLILLFFTLGATTAAAIYAKQAARATHVGAIADQASAAAADETLKEMQKTARLELRARLAAIPAGVNQLVGERDAMGHVDLRNVGKIPARNVTLWMDVRFSDYRDTDFGLPTKEKLQRADRAIQPDTAMRQGSGVVPVSDIIKGERGRYVYIWGVAYYDDGHGFERFTKFCHRYAAAAYNRGEDWDGVPQKPRNIIAASEARFHSEGNEAD